MSEIHFEGLDDAYHIRGLSAPSYMLMDAKGARYMCEKSGNALPDWLVGLPDETPLEFIDGEVRIPTK